MDKEMQQFTDDLLESVRQMNTGKAARLTEVKVSAAVEAQLSVGMSQHDFARMLGVSVRTLQDWGQGRRPPTGAACALLKIAWRALE
jgi:putative transcriptional regulator